MLGIFIHILEGSSKFYDLYWYKFVINQCIIMMCSHEGIISCHIDIDSSNIDEEQLYYNVSLVDSCFIFLS